MQKSTENVAKSPELVPEVPKWPFLRMHSKMLLIMTANAAKCSTFEVQYGKSTSTKTSAIRHITATLTDRVISRMRTNLSMAFNTELYALT